MIGKRLLQGIGIIILVCVALWFVLAVRENPHVTGNGIPPETTSTSSTSRVRN